MVRAISTSGLIRIGTTAVALLCTRALGAQSVPTTPCWFVSDSGGSTADSGTSISLTFDGQGSVSFSGSGSVQMQDSGTYSVAGNVMTISLPGVGKSGHGLWSLQVSTLRVPFQLFSDAAGSSLWSCIPTGGSSGSQTPPPPPPNPPGGGSGGGSGSGKTGSGTDSGNPGTGHGSGANGQGNHSGQSGGDTSGGEGQSGSNNNDDPGGSDKSGGNDPGRGDGPGKNGSNPLPSKSSPPSPDQWQNSPVAPYVGDWVGIGWAWEVRFRSGDWNGHPNEKNSVMTLTVRHLTRFDFTVDAKGQVVGNGEVTYDLDPNLCGVYRAAEQINMAIDVLKNFNSALSKMRQYATDINDIFGTKSQIEASEAKDKIDSWKKFKNADSDTQFGVKQTHASPWRNMGHNAEDTGDLAASVWYERCSKGAPVSIVGGLSCEDLLGGPPLTEPGEVLSTSTKLANAVQGQAKDIAKDAWKKLQEKDPNFWNHDANYLYTTVAGEAVDAAADALKEKTLKTLNVFDI